ncbi:AMP-binding protein [Streptomyces sp. NPDC096132]|uniref:AMP-binding protein n=1 Tax=Streptomyces sp. NPDC096132 TaxID=3366075 RepID=UPI003803670A
MSGPVPGANPSGAVGRHLLAVADACADRPAIIQGERVVRWREFAADAARLAADLDRLGIGAGSRVALYCRNRPEYLVALFALFTLDAVPVNVNYRYRATELAYVLRDCQAAGVIHAAELGDVVDEVWSGPRIAVDTERGGFDLASTSADAGPPSGSPAGLDEWLLYTGGTTGMPKAVVGSQRERLGVNYGIGLGHIGWPGEPDPPVHQVVAYQRENGIEPVYFAVAPLMHGTGLYCALIGMTIGATVVLTESRSFDVTEIARVIGARRVTDMHVVGEAMLLPLVDVLDEARQGGTPYDVGSLRRVQSSGTVWTPRTKRRLLAHADAELTDMIAATEGGPFALSVTSRTRPPADDTPFALVPGARLLRDDGTDVTPGSGEAGVLAAPTAAGAHYLGDPARTATTYRDVDGQRYVAPGDLATVDTDGTVTLLGRGSSVINTGGEKVYPDEVEDALRRHPSVRDVTVAGLPHERFGSVVGAVVVPADQHADPAELTQFVAARLSSFKKPRVVVFVPEIQRLASGKTDLSWVRKKLESKGVEANV